MKKTAEPEDLLARGLEALELDVDLGEPLLRYVAELLKWNAAYNLTAVRDPAEMVARHLLDSLAVLAPIAALGITRLIDVGSGAGLPGLVLAVARPDWEIDVLDSNGKKARFLRHAVRTLGLRNVAVIEARAEQHRPERPYIGVLSRAFSALGDFVRTTEHLLADDGYWLAMKGRLDDNEIAGLADLVSAPRCLALAVPGLREERHLVIATRAALAARNSTARP